MALRARNPASAPAQRPLRGAAILQNTEIKGAVQAALDAKSPEPLYIHRPAVGKPLTISASVPPTGSQYLKVAETGAVVQVLENGKTVTVQRAPQGSSSPDK